MDNVPWVLPIMVQMLSAQLKDTQRFEIPELRRRLFKLSARHRV